MGRPGLGEFHLCSRGSLEAGLWSPGWAGIPSAYPPALPCPRSVSKLLCILCLSLSRQRGQELDSDHQLEASNGSQAPGEPRLGLPGSTLAPGVGSRTVHGWWAGTCSLPGSYSCSLVWAICARPWPDLIAAASTLMPWRPSQGSASSLRTQKAEARARAAGAGWPAEPPGVPD